MNNTPGVTLRHNSEKNGIEIKFPDKPNVAERDKLKAAGFRWSKFSKVWYKQINPAALAFASRYGTIPDSIKEEVNPDGLLVQAQEDAYFDNFCHANSI